MADYLHPILGLSVDDIFEGLKAESTLHRSGTFDRFYIDTALKANAGFTVLKAFIEDMSPFSPCTPKRTLV